MKKKVLSIIAAVLMAFSLMPAISVTAFAADNTTAGTATLTIINGVSEYTGAAVVLNKKYSFEKGATLEDLFAAAVAAGDLEDYAFSYGYINSVTAGSVTIQNKADYSYYWANYKNGEYAQGYTDCTNTDVLTDGVCFQFAYESYPANVAPDSWSDVEKNAEKSTVIAGDSSKQVAGTTTLCVVKGVSYSGATTLVNKKFDFYEGATLGDLLAAAKTDGAITGYNFSYGYLNSITPAGGDAVSNAGDYSTYWAVFKNGTYAQGNTDGTETDLLTDGGSFEYAWEDYPAKVGLSKDEWTALSAKATDSDRIAQGDIYPSQNTDAAAAADLAADTETKYDTLFNNLTAAAVKDGNSWNALCLAAIGQASDADKESAIRTALAAAENPNGTNLQASIIVLASLGVDCTAVTKGDQTTNLMDVLANTSGAIGGWTESLAYTLLAYAAVPSYGVSNKAVNSPEHIIDSLMAYQCADGGFGWGGTSSPDSTGAAIAALSCYTDYEDAQSMIKDAVAYLKSAQNADGGYGYAKGEETNSDSTAQAIIGLCAAGIDPTGSDFTKNGKNPLTALLALAKSDNSGFTYDGTGSDVSQDGYRALVAYSGFRNTGKAYNLYTQASSGVAKLVIPEAKKDVPKTGDSNGLLLALILMAAAAGTFGIALTAKKKYEK